MKFKFFKKTLYCFILALSFFMPFQNCAIGNSSVLKMANGDLSSRDDIRNTLVNLDTSLYSLSPLASSSKVNQLVFCTKDKKKLNTDQWLSLLNYFKFDGSSSSLLPIQNQYLVNLNLSFTSTVEYDKDTSDYSTEQNNSTLVLSNYKTSYKLNSSSGELDFSKTLAIGWYKQFIYKTDYKNGAFQTTERSTSFVCNYSSSTYFASYNMTTFDNEYLTPNVFQMISQYDNDSSSYPNENIDYSCFLWFYKEFSLPSTKFLDGYNSLPDDEKFIWVANGDSIGLIESKSDNSPSFENGYQSGYTSGYNAGITSGENGNAYNQGYNQGRTDSNQEFYEKVSDLTNQLDSLKKDYDSLNQSYHNYETIYNANTLQEYWQQGYSQGLTAVTNDSSSLISLFGAITTIPLNILNGLAVFSIWNTPVIYLIITFLFLAVVFWSIKKFI